MRRNVGGWLGCWLAGLALAAWLAVGRAAAQEAPGNQPSGPEPLALAGALRMAAFGPDELPAPFAAPRMRTMAVPEAFRAYHGLASIRIDVEGPGQYDDIAYTVYPTEADARGRFEAATIPPGATLTGRTAPPDFAEPALCVSYTFGSGQTARSKTECVVLVGNVEVMGAADRPPETRAAEVEDAIALARAGREHLARVLAGPLPAPIGRVAPDDGHGHVAVGTAVPYISSPPSSGPHYPNWTNSGVYADPPAVGNWVHSLEHGYVVLLYNCPAGCPELVEQLRQFYEAAPRSERYGYQKLIVSSYAAMAHPLAAVAWGHLDELEAFDAERLLAFYSAYHDRGPEDAG